MIFSSALTFEVAKKSKGCGLLIGGMEGSGQKLNVSEQTLPAKN